MATNRGSGAATHIRTLFGAGTLAGLTDGQLLEWFTTRDGAEAELAFAVIVQRHGPMVLRVCRSILDDPHDAEDAFQATFLVLVRRVGSIRKRDSVASWLHGVACRTASCARADEARRRRHERRAAESSVCPETEVIRDDPGPVLYEELEQLPGRYREPIVLCDLEGLTHEQAAHQLALPVGTVKSRLTRGRGRLRDRLQRRGLAPSIGASGAMFAAETASAEVTRRLAGSAVRAAMWFAAGDGSVAGEVPATVAALTGKVLKTMFRNRLLKATLLASIAGSVAVGTGMILAHQGRAVGAPPHAAPAAEGVGSAVGGSRMQLDLQDFVSAYGLDIYKYRVNIPEGQRFSVILRELDGPGSPARILHRESFLAYAGAGTIVASFKRMDSKMTGVLHDTEEKECGYRLDCDNCSPGGATERIPLPLGGAGYVGSRCVITSVVDMSRRTERVRKSLAEADSELSPGVTVHLLTVTGDAAETGTFPPTEVNHYPRAELVLVLDR